MLEEIKAKCHIDVLTLHSVFLFSGSICVEFKTGHDHLLQLLQKLGLTT